MPALATATRRSLLILLITGSSVLAANTRPKTEAWERFKKEHGPAWSVEWNRHTGSPHRISGSSLTLHGINRNTIERIALEFILRYGDLLGADAASLELSKAEFDPPEKGPKRLGTWNVMFRQVYRGIPVQGGSVRLIIRSGQVTSFGSDFFPDIDVPAQPVVSLDQAIEKVRRDMNLEGFGAPLSSRLIVFPDVRSGTLRYYLAWEIVTPVVPMPDLRARSQAPQGSSSPPVIEIVPAQWRCLIDAISGKIIDRTNLMVSAIVSGHVTGTARSHPTDPPQTVDLANLTVTAVQRTITFPAETDKKGMYLINLPFGPTTIQARLAGPHVVVHNDETPDPDTTHTASVIPSAIHDWNFSVDDPSPNDVEVQAYYHVDAIREWFLRGAPFNVSPEPDPMTVRVRNGAYCNAMAGPGGLFFGSGGGACPDLTLCADIIYHEYGHRIVERVYADANVSLFSALQGATMHEAYADYFACTFTNDPSHGEGCHSGRNIDTPNFRFPDHLGNGPHGDGVIFSGALWDLRSVLGATYVDALAIRAMKQAPLSFSEYLLAVLEEDDDPSFNSSPLADANLANGTPNINAICHSYFDLHGIFDSHCVGRTQAPVAIITAPPPADVNLLASSVSSVTITGTALHSSQGFQSYTLDYAHESAPNVFLTAGLAITGGGSFPISNGTLGTLNTTVLANGFYIIRLTVRDTSGRSTVAQTNIAVDRTLMSGWPQAANVEFRGAPAVADLDPAFPGLEVAARGEDGMLRVWHRDGTPVAGFPIYAGGWFAAPAVGDLDGDGALEIVIVDDFAGSVSAFRRNGTIVSGWPQLCPGGTAYLAPALGDLDGDGKLEIIVGSEGNRVCAWRHDGVALAGWPVVTSDRVRSSAAIADVDRNGLPEVIAGSFDGNLYVWRADGTTLPGWPVNLMHQASASPAAGDLDGDGDLEIVAGEYIASTFSSRIHVLHDDGTPVAGWPQSVSNSFSVPLSAVTADVDRDGSLDVIVQLYDNSVHVWRGNGTPLPGWPMLGFGGYEFFPSAAPVVGDVDGDGNADLVWESNPVNIGGKFVDRVVAFHADATPVAGWPKNINGSNPSAPTLADIDADGNVDVVVGAKGVFVWKLSAPFTRGPRDWLAYRRDQRRTGQAAISGPQQPVIDANAPTLVVRANPKRALAQTMVFLSPGILTEVALPVQCSAGSDLILSIEEVAGLRPNGVLRSHQVIPGSTLPPFSPHPPFLRNFVLATPVQANAGKSFAIVLRSSGECSVYQGPVGNPYPGGDLYRDNLPSPFFLWICVCEIPAFPTPPAFDLPFMTTVY